MLARRQSQPGSKASSVAESVDVPDTASQSRCGEYPDARDRVEAVAHLGLPSDLTELPLDAYLAPFELPDLLQQLVQHVSNELRHLGSLGIDRTSKLLHAPITQRGDDAKLTTEPA